MDDILEFEVELEAQNKQTKLWRAIDRKNVKTNYMDVSLPAGNYRYRVRVINLLGQKEDVSDYREFAVRFAYQPELTSVTPQVINFDELEDHTLQITGKNFHEDTSFSLVNRLSGGVLTGTLVELNEEGTHASVAFEFSKAPPGTYTFSARDPSDLFAESEGIVFRFQKPVDVFLSGGYVFTGFPGHRLFKEYFKTSFSALGAGMRITVAPIKRYYGNFGFNFSGSGFFLQQKTPEYKLKAGMLLAHFNAVYMYPIIKRRLTFDVHAGFGAAFLVNTQFYYPPLKLYSPKAWYWGMTLNAGTAFYVYMYKKLFVEFNIDHILPFRKGFPQYIIQPQLSIGWEF
ncbi:MAG: fibronectin type III domain-containing protein [Treponema sp.]